MERKARKGVNPQTRGTIQIPAKKVPKFKPGKGLREKAKQKKNKQYSFRRMTRWPKAQ